MLNEKLFVIDFILNVKLTLIDFNLRCLKPTALFDFIKTHKRSWILHKILSVLFENNGRVSH